MAHIIPAQSGTQCVYLTNLYLIKTFREKYHVSRLISNKVSPHKKTETLKEAHITMLRRLADSKTQSLCHN